MKKIVVYILTLLVVGTATAQKLTPVQWSYEAVKKSDKQYDIVISATIESPWHIYSQFVKGGPIPTTFQFKPNPLVQLSGKTKEVGKLEKKFDKNFNAVIATFANKVQFIQTVNLKVASKTKIAGVIEFTVCNDEKCLPPSKIPFEVILQ